MNARQASKPVKELRLGRVRAAIWQNDTKAGLRHGVTFSRLYRTEDAKWANSTTFDRQDLLVLAQLAEKAFATLHGEFGEDSASEEPEAADMA
jgi:hypothetical protein